MNPIFYSEGAGERGCRPFPLHSQSPPNLPPLRSGQFRLTIPNTYSTITMSASLRSDCCSPSLRNAVRLPSEIDVHLHRNTQMPGFHSNQSGLHVEVSCVPVHSACWRGVLFSN